MDVTASLATDAPPERLFEWIADLGRYPEWLEIVPRAVPCVEAAAAFAVYDALLESRKEQTWN